MNLICKWNNPSCQKTFSTAEELFNHLCDFHVGRKRHGNLSLSCSWEGCDHKAAKRDHMTSHMMVHCPLQTNVCGICEKTFKRSYDLRKHEVTHTAEHHQAHTRSRAVIYQDLQLPISTQLNNSSPINYSALFNLPPQWSSLSSDSKPVSRQFKRSNSAYSTRSHPYHKNRSKKVNSFAHTSDNQFQAIASSSSAQNLGMIQEGSSTSSTSFTNPFSSFYEDNSFYSQSPKSDNLTTTQFLPAFTLDNSPLVNLPMDLTIPNFNLIESSFPKNFKNSSQQNLFSLPNHFPDLVTDQALKDILRADLLPTDTLYPKQNSFNTTNDNFNFNNPLIPPPLDDTTSLIDPQFMNFFSSEQPSYHFMDASDTQNTIWNTDQHLSQI
ncbi:hypothetical protein O181_094954 [Austropuccinia psidii MF-1]|uniref:C2H2-type domain-containing protein n=1 Tax=Austropuccinia psidii MF-1 TaxID=1389203 RepID=A0A9Q3J458_9BASI|nr:hypothetical protein [Austropuccinia psidii MF-1]